MSWDTPTVEEIALLNEAIEEESSGRYKPTHAFDLPPCLRDLPVRSQWMMLRHWRSRFIAWNPDGPLAQAERARHSTANDQAFSLTLAQMREEPDF